MLSVLNLHSDLHQNGPKTSFGKGASRERVVCDEGTPLNTLTDGALTVAQIVFVNAVLSGDNALVIALTSRQLPPALRKRAVLWGSALAVLLQVAFAILVGYLLEVPGLRLAGAIALILIARKLIGEAREEARESRSTTNVLGAVLTILIANLAMSLDNVLAVGALSRGFPSLIALGLGVSAVMLLAASALMITLIERYRWVTFAGAAVLACTAAGMICEEPLLAGAASFANANGQRIAAAIEKEPEPEPIVVQRPLELMTAATDSAATKLTRTWSFAVYGLALSLCFGSVRWWSAIRRFERERESSVVEAEPLYVHG